MTVSYLSILESREHDCVRLRLTGELDVASCPLLDERLRELRAGGFGVRLDLSRLDFIDSAGFHALIRTMQSASGTNWRLQIDQHVSAAVMRVLGLVQFERLIPGYDSSRG
jgi:anti-anti-sigma factor